MTVLGASGMLGSMVTDVLERDGRFSITATVRDPDVAAALQELLPNVRVRIFEAALSGAEWVPAAEWVVDCIGLTKPLIDEGSAASISRAHAINTDFSVRLAELCEASGTRLLRIATDCVYAGGRGQYDEGATHDATDVYGRTKSQGEARGEGVCHLRCSIVGPEPRQPGRFLLEWLLRQSQGARVTGYKDHRWNGLTTLHFARIVAAAIGSYHSLPDLQHVVPADELDKAQLLAAMASAFDRGDLDIVPTMTGNAIGRRPSNPC